MVVPLAGNTGEVNRLPIFESVESDWFRRGRKGVGRAVATEATAATSGWTSPADPVGRPPRVARSPVQRFEERRRVSRCAAFQRSDSGTLGRSWISDPGQQSGLPLRGVGLIIAIDNDRRLSHGTLAVPPLSYPNGWMVGSAPAGAPYIQTLWFRASGTAFIASAKVGPKDNGADLKALAEIIHSLSSNPQVPDPRVRIHG